MSDVSGPQGDELQQAVDQAEQPVKPASGEQTPPESTGALADTEPDGDEDEG